MSSLTKQQQTTVAYLGGLVVSVVLVAAMLLNLSSSRAAVTKIRQDVERKESKASSLRPATPEEEAKWTEQETQINNLLLPEQAVPQFFEEVTRIATENGIQRLGMTTDEVTIDPNKASSPAEAKVIGVGIKRYLTVTMKFQGQYADIARFMGGVVKLDRPIEYHLVDLKRVPGLIEAQLVMNVYKRDAS
jgi:Tfp pilus assembly protein PilO